MRPFVALLACALAGCAMRAPSPSVSAPVQPAPAAPAVIDLSPYFGLLEKIATADEARDAALLGELQAQLAQSPDSRAALRHALALGSAGHEASDPVEAAGCCRHCSPHPAISSRPSCNWPPRCCASSMRA